MHVSKETGWRIVRHEGYCLGPSLDILCVIDMLDAIGHITIEPALMPHQDIGLDTTSCLAYIVARLNAPLTFHPFRRVCCFYSTMKQTCY